MFTIKSEIKQLRHAPAGQQLLQRQPNIYYFDAGDNTVEATETPAINCPKSKCIALRCPPPCCYIIKSRIEINLQFNHTQFNWPMNLTTDFINCSLTSSRLLQQCVTKHTDFSIIQILLTINQTFTCAAAHTNAHNFIQMLFSCNWKYFWRRLITHISICGITINLIGCQTHLFPSTYSIQTFISFICTLSIPINCTFMHSTTHISYHTLNYKQNAKTGYSIHSLKWRTKKEATTYNSLNITIIFTYS